MGELIFIFCYLASISILTVFTIYSAFYGDIYAVIISFSIALAIDQAKAFLIQPVIWWVFIRRFGRLDIAEDPEWDDERIFREGENVSLLNNARQKVKDFLENPKVSYFIYFMVILLCIVILTELSIADSIGDNNTLSEIFININFVLLLFFLVEIALRLFADGIEFLSEFINVFDM